MSGGSIPRCPFSIVRFITQLHRCHVHSHVAHVGEHDNISPMTCESLQTTIVGGECAAYAQHLQLQHIPNKQHAQCLIMFSMALPIQHVHC